jgi:hypothetical protein
MGIRVPTTQFWSDNVGKPDSPFRVCSSYGFRLGFREPDKNIFQLCGSEARALAAALNRSIVRGRSRGVRVRAVARCKWVVLLSSLTLSFQTKSGGTPRLLNL